MMGKGRTCLLTVAGDDIDDTRRQAGDCGQLSLHNVSLKFRILH